MKLSEKERQVFLALQADGAAPIAELAKRCGLSDNTVRYSIESMVKRSILHTSLVLDEAKLGLRHIKLLLNIQVPHDSSLEAIEKVIISSPSVAWLARVAGDYSHYLSLYVSVFSEVERFFDLLIKRAGSIITRKLMAEGTGWEYYGKKYLHPAGPESPVVRTGFPSPPVELDPMDVQILGELVARPLAPVRDLAQALGRPSSSISYRINRLRELGIIGVPITRIRVNEGDYFAYKAEIRAKFPSARFSEELHAFALQHPNIVELCNCFGAWDFSAGLEAENAATMNKTVSELTIRFAEYIDGIILLPRFADIATKFDIRRAFRSMSIN